MWLLGEFWAYIQPRLPTEQAFQLWLSNQILVQFRLPTLSNPIIVLKTVTANTAKMKQSRLSNFFKTPALDLNPVKKVLYGKPISLQQRSPTQTRPSAKRSYEATKRKHVFQEAWLGSFNWLRHDKKNNVMYCDTCREFKHLHPVSDIALIKGDCSFRKSSLDAHGGSRGHRRCMDASKAKHNPQETPLAKIQRKLTSEQQYKMVYLFNSAHSVAMHNWSLRDFKAVCELQVKNGVLMGDNYQNPQGCSNFIHRYV